MKVGLIKSKRKGGIEKEKGKKEGGKLIIIEREILGIIIVSSKLYKILWVPSQTLLQFFIKIIMNLYVK
jgi:hypothetical protein